jgi:hypothetical protein
MQPAIYINLKSSFIRFIIKQKLRHYATNRKVAGSIPDEVIFLNLPNPSGRTRLWGLLSLKQKGVYQKHKNNNVSGE